MRQTNLQRVVLLGLVALLVPLILIAATDHKQPRRQYQVVDGSLEIASPSSRAFQLGPDSAEAIGWGVMAAAATNASSPNFAVEGTAGQPVVGVSSSPSFGMSQGYLSEPVPSYLCGDANGDGTVNITDAVYLINYIFGGGPAPEPLVAGDVNCDETVNITDAVYLITYIFGGGPEPCAECP